MPGVDLPVVLLLELEVRWSSVEGSLIQVMDGYDNERDYTNEMIREARPNLELPAISSWR